MKRQTWAAMALAISAGCIVSAQQPGTTQPGTTQPGTTQPGTARPGTSQPGTPQSSGRDRYRRP